MMPSTLGRLQYHHNVFLIIFFLSCTFLSLMPVSSCTAQTKSTPLHHCNCTCTCAPQWEPLNMKLRKAYSVFQSWKNVITCDPQDVTSDWYGANVCDYTGVYCSPAPDDPNVLTVSGIDLNGAGICGTLPEELGLLADLALVHLNSNRFTGKIPSLAGGRYELSLYI